MAISHRLHSPMDIRPDEEINERPRRIVFLSVEGAKTEKDYFKYVQKFKKQLGIHALVHVETLSRFSRDTCSDPQKVFELLTEYLQIREQGILPEDIYEVLNKDAAEYSLDTITRYLNDELPNKDSKKLKSTLQLVGIDIDYQKFLSNFKGDGNNDVFGIVIDRDQGNHSEDSLKKIFKKCEDNNCYCFLTNPCFEFWLLLHVSDVKEEYCGRYDELLANRKISVRHTFTSAEVEKKAGHSKSISEKRFVENYLCNIDKALERAAEFCQDGEPLLNELGSNLPLLFQILREDINQHT